MNLYLISQTSNPRKYDIFRNAVVVAASISDAKFIHPYDEFCWNGNAWSHKVKEDRDYSQDDSWVEPHYVNVVYIGKADSVFEAGTVINASFKAG